MREGWREVKLGDVARRRTDYTEVEQDKEYSIVGLLRSGQGFVSRGSTPATSMKFSRLMQLRPDDLVYRTITAFEAPAAVGSKAETGLFVTPQTFPVYVLNDSIEPPYMRLQTQWPAFHHEMSTRCTGTVLRRKTLAPAGFEAIPLLLPPLAEQRRIADLIEALDVAISTANRAQTELAGVVELLRAKLPDGEWVPLADVLLAIESGTSTKLVDGDGPRRRMLTLAAIRPASFRPSETKDIGVAQLPAKALAKDGDLLITRSNTPDRVGHVAIAKGIREQTYLPDLVWRLRTDESLVRKDYLAQVLSSSKLRAAITGSASGTSMSMRKINKTNFARIRVPLPSLSVQETYADLLEQAGAVRDAIQQHLLSQRRLRANLLDALLSGEHEIPESYDALQEG